MKTVAIVCEYNPFHRGHKYQLEQIKKDFGDDTCIVSVMSGNYAQRGELAILDKFTRAKIAVMEGVSLVLELPFPFSMQSAEIFASSAIHIICQAVMPDALSFGCENEDKELMKTVAHRLLSDEFNEEFIICANKKSEQALGHPKLYESIYKKLYNDVEGQKLLRNPNNILGLEYIKSLIRENYSAKLHTVKRVGSRHDQALQTENEFASSSAIRELFLDGRHEKALLLLPEFSREICAEALANGALPVNNSRLSNAILAFLRMNPPSKENVPFDCDGGLAHRLYNSSLQAADINQLITLALTKRYTNARIRRAILNFYFGITSSDVKNLPNYTQVLAMDGKGRRKLKEMKSHSRIEILTKPADFTSLSAEAQAQAETSNRADRIYSLAKPIISSGDEFLRATPFCKK